MVLFIAACLYAFFSLGSMATMSIGAAVLGAGIFISAKTPNKLLKQFKTEQKQPASHLITTWALLLTAACIFSDIVATFWPIHYGNRPFILEYSNLSKLWYLFWPVIIAAGLRDHLTAQQKRRVVEVWLIACGIFSIIGIQQYWTSWPNRQDIPDTVGGAASAIRYHATIFLGHHLSTASIWIFPAFASFDLAWRKKWNWAWVVSAMSFAVLILTFSRGLWAAIPVGFATYGFVVLPRRKSWVFLAAILVAIAIAFQFPEVQVRVKNGDGYVQRQKLWEAHLGMFKDRPLTGTGYRTGIDVSNAYLETKYPGQGFYASHAHNNAIDFLGNTGLLGFLSWLGYCVSIFVVLWKAYRKRSSSDRVFPEFAAGLIAAWVVFHLNGLTQLNFWDAKVQHQSMFMVALSLLW